MLSFIAIVVVAIIIYCAIYLSIKINVLLVVHDACEMYLKTSSLSCPCCPHLFSQEKSLAVSQLEQ